MEICKPAAKTKQKLHPKTSLRLQPLEIVNDFMFVVKRKEMREKKDRLVCWKVARKLL